VPLAAALRGALDGVDLDTGQIPALGGVLPELALRGRAATFGEIDVLEAIVEVIRRTAPLVLILDDLHLADPSTVAALEYLRHRCARCQVMVVGALRDDDALDHPVRGLTATETIRLEPLTEHDLAPLGIVDAHERTGGHPALVANLITSGGSDPDLRGSLSELMLARCRAEGAVAFRILLTAATLPQPFEPEVLAGLLDTDPVALIEELEQLCDRRILRVDGPRFGFRYAIVRDVLGAAVSPARRRLLRERAEILNQRRELVSPSRHDLPLVSATAARS
jgi:hypothetical protein